MRCSASSAPDRSTWRTPTVKAPRRLRALTAVPVLVLVLALPACGGSTADDADAPSGAGTTPAPPASAGSTVPVAEAPIGARCDVLPAEGAGSLAALATTPAGTAVNTN